MQVWPDFTTRRQAMTGRTVELKNFLGRALDCLLAVKHCARKDPESPSRV